MDGGLLLVFVQKTDRSDVLLFWLVQENGIFTAINDGYLKAFQLCVFLEEDKPNHIHEAYTFAISYKKSPSGRIVIADGFTVTDVILSGKSDSAFRETVNILQAKKCLQSLVRRLIMATQSLESLPGKIPLLLHKSAFVQLDDWH